MSSPRTLSPGSHAYLDAVRRQLADLPAADQGDLADQVEQRLRDLDAGAEPGGPEERLGPAAEMAADLRAAAGFGPAPVRGAPPRRRLTSRELARSAAGAPVVRPVLAYLVSLRPAWWAVRGYLLVTGLLAVLGKGGAYVGLMRSGAPLREVLEASQVSPAWLLVPAVVVVASIALGKVSDRLPVPARLIVTALDLAAVAVVLVFPAWWLAPVLGFHGSFF